MEDQKKEIDADFTIVERKNMRRGKPQQQIYKPGSGKLRRSNPGFDDTVSESGSTRSVQSGFGSTDDFRNRSELNPDTGANKSLQKREKKPEREFYVPRPVAQARDQLSPQGFQNYGQESGFVNGTENTYPEKMYKSKRYSSNRSHGDNNNGRDNSQNEWRDKSPNRNYRMGSEPRGGFSNGPSWTRDRDRDRHRERDTRSVEPTGIGGRNNNHESGKFQAKPPSGRRHSTTGNYQYDIDKRKNLLKNLENVPPRFRKKYLEDNGLSADDVNWDTNTFSQPPVPQQQPQQNSGFRALDVYSTLPHATPQPAYNSNLNSGYHTLPNRGRGRGRFHHVEPEFQPGPVFRSITPDRASIPRSPANSRPGTPTRRFDSRPPSRPPSRSQTPLSYHDDNRYPNDSWGDKSDRGGAKSGGFDRLGGRTSEARHLDRDRDRRVNDFNKQRRDDDNRHRRGEDNRNRRNESDRKGDFDKDRSQNDRRDDHRKGDRKRRGGGRERRSSSRDFVVHASKESNFSNDSNRTFTGENRNDSWNANVQPASQQIPVEVQEQARSQPPNRIGSASNDAVSGPESILETEKLHEPIVERLNEDRDILDWNEEVELNHRLEAEAFSDAMTRSSSMGSLHEISTRSMPTSTTATPNTKKKRKSGRRKSKQRSGSNYRDKTPTNNRDRKDSFASVESRDNFKVPHDPSSDRHGRRRRRSSREPRDLSFDRFHNRSRGPSRDTSFDRNQQSGVTENWRDEIIRSRQNSEREGSVLSRRVSSDRSRKNSELEEHVLETSTKKGGILVLPPKSPESQHIHAERPKFPEVRTACGQQKTLFDPKNPSKPILVKSPGSRVAVPGFSENAEAPKVSKVHIPDSSGKLPAWYNENSDNFKACHYPELLRDIKRADSELQFIMNSGLLLVNYDAVDNLRQFLKSGLEYLLCKAIRFCQTENVEQHVWSILYYNIIEITRKAIIDDPDNKPHYKEFLLYIIDEGTKYFERLIDLLEETYDFKVVNYIGNNSMMQHKKITGLALVSAQKIFMFLGNLGRYREQVNETSNYGKCRQWYIKSQEINPKNGKPYNQLAVLAVYSRRKLDAVYYYMRSLMSSNPVPTAKQNLIALFDENRKKYEQGEKKRREERLERQKQHMKQKESEESGGHNFLRKETWIHPEGGRRLHRTTKALQEDLQDSEEEDLAALSSVDVNKRFVTSYLHVHGKLITNIGLETFQDASMQMLKEFRALLQHSPVSLPCNRFLQLLALNMYAIESTQLKDPNLQQLASYRSELQERALIVSLQMFNLILERCVSILQDHFNSFLNQEKPGSPLDSLPHDANVLLPAIKVWCDWMLCHTSVWNPPPSTQDFKVGPSGDLWSRLGLLMNILERMAQDSPKVLVKETQEGYEAVRLPEDATLCGFTPLILDDREVWFAPPTVDSETAQLRLRVAKLLFFGTVCLCGLEPPVLKLEIEDGRRDYVSVVCSDRGQDSPREEAVLARSDEVLLETFSDDENETAGEKRESKLPSPTTETSSEVNYLRSRKQELEEKSRNQELRQQQVMKILSQSVVSVHLEIRPKYLVPDTNCFIDHLDSIQAIAKTHTYTIMVPIVVLSELEGLGKGTPSPTSKGKFAPSPDHVQRVAAASRSALDFLKKRHAAVKCVTTKGAVLASTTFSTEDDATWDATVKNDDKILATCLVLCKGHGKEQQQIETKEGEPRHLFREVVLLTEDRNLRVKALARDVPVRALPDFMRWAGLGG